MLKELGRKAIRHEVINAIYIKVYDGDILNKLYGDNFIRKVTEQIKTFLNNEIKRINRYIESSVRYISVSEHEFIIYWEKEYQDDNDELNSDLTFLFKMNLENTILNTFIQEIGQKPRIKASHVSGFQITGQAFEKNFTECLAILRERARVGINVKKLKLADEFQQILLKKQIKVLYQPILNFANGRIYGWEALSRGPKGSIFRSPVTLFDFAEKSGELFALEKSCREKAIASFGSILPEQKIFINIHPRTLADPEFTPGKTREILWKYNCEPKNIVFEITEKHSIKDFSVFHKTLDHYRNQGFKIALDDVGAGYSGLWSMAELRPDFIKIDMDLVRNIDRNPIKRALMETLVTFAEKVSSRIIAEGIETETELNAIIDMGVHFGQGYYIARPGYPPSHKVATPASGCEVSVLPKISSRNATCLLPIGDLTENVLSVHRNTRIEKLHKLINDDPSIASIVVCDQHERPVGLIMTHNLIKKLASQYGISLYYKKKASVLMDNHPIIVDQNTPSEQVAQKATCRERFRAYDDIIVTANDRLVGIVSVQKLIDYMVQVQLEMAKGSNPLTGLPGNCAIEQIIEKKLSSLMSFSIIYADLDNFKVYNDTYGFKKGDELIKLLSYIMDWAARRHGNTDDFLGHVGGDDFILLTTPERAERISVSITRCFKRLIRRHYSTEDRKKGRVRAKGRDGRESWFSLVSVSLAIVDCQKEAACPCSLQQIGERAAEIKALAKAIEGNSYFRDPRSLAA
ncbi:EAL domain-containing protein [Desulfolithobacter sp.]